MQDDIFGEAITAFFKTKKEQVITVSNEDFDDDEIAVSYLFRDYKQMPPIEQKALQLSKGKVLDVGCGAGSHSLYLQNTKKIDVTAIDTSTGAINICNLRGITNTNCEDFYKHKGTYDTLLFLMNGSGIIGKLEQFNAFFTKVKELLAPNGQVFIDSSDLIFLFENENGEHWIDATKGYYGELKYQISFNHKSSEIFDWLYVDFNTLKRACQVHGFNCELILEGNHYDYLAKLTLI